MLRGQQPGWNTKKLSIKVSPSPREVYWIGMFSDSLEPEFTGYHPGVIIGGAKTIRENVETVTFVPLTSEEPRKNAHGNYPPYVVELSDNPSPSDARRVWAICNQVMTVRLTRLERYIGPRGLTVPRVGPGDFSKILDGIVNGMTTLRDHFDHKTKVKMDAMKIEYDALIAVAEGDVQQLDAPANIRD